MATIQKTIGSGDVGSKSAALRRDKKAIEGAGLYFPDHVSFTPQFFRRFLDDSGAREGNTFYDSDERLHACEFRSDERDDIRSALYDLAKPYVHVLMARSDDYAAGVGIWKSVPIAVNFHSVGKEDIPKAVEAALPLVEKQFKTILGSDFSKNAKEFKRKKGIGDIGVMLMPLVGSIFRAYGRIYASPRACISYLGEINDDAFFSVGAGYDGANEIARPYNYYKASTLRAEHFFELVDRKLGRAVNLADSGASDHVDLPRVSDPAAMFLINVVSKIKKLIDMTGPRYLEIAWSHDSCLEGAVVQTAPFEVPKLDGTPPSAVLHPLISTSHVIGTSLANAEKIKYVEGEPSDDDLLFNRDNRDYLLVVKLRYNTEFNNAWGVAAFSNAAGVVLHTEPIANPLCTHLGGGIREIGVPILAGTISDAMLASLKKQPLQNIKSLVYADEFHPEGPRGFVSLDCRDSVFSF